MTVGSSNENRTPGTGGLLELPSAPVMGVKFMLLGSGSTGFSASVQSHHPGGSAVGRRVALRPLVVDAGTGLPFTSTSSGGALRLGAWLPDVGSLRRSAAERVRFGAETG